MEQNENNKEKQKSKSVSYWAWGIPTAIVIYVLSPGPVIFLMVKIEKIIGPVKWIEYFLGIFYYPLILITENKVPILSDTLETYVKFWLELAGVHF
jgi:hypothetical protein